MNPCTCKDGCRCTATSCACKGDCKCAPGCACQSAHKASDGAKKGAEGCCQASAACGCKAATAGQACACAAGCGCCAKAKGCGSCTDGTCPACVGPRRKAPAMGKISWWGAIGLGSTVGIAAWATLYVVGAAIASAIGGGPGLGLGLWGAVAASLALAMASATATLALSTRCPVRAVLTGLALWGLATITLVGMALALEAGLAAHLGVLGRQIFAVGGSAIGATGVLEQGSSTPVLGAMAGVMVLSLVFALGGGLWARNKISETA